MNSAVGGNCTPPTAQLYIDKGRKVWYYNNALAVTEDRATQECDLSAGYGVGGKSDTMDGVALLFSLLYACYHSSRKPQCVKLRVRAEPDAPKVPYASDLRHSLPLAHGFLAIDHKGIGVVYDAVADGVCQDGITDLVPPAGNVEL